MDEDFKYEHVVKLPWLAALIWTVLLSLVFQAYPVKSILEEIIRLFVFGISWWFLFQSIDNWASEYRRKVLFKDPDLKRAFITNALAEWEITNEEC